MKFEYLETTQDNVKIYARIDEDGICRLTCTEDYSEYQNWLEQQAALEAK